MFVITDPTQVYKLHTTHSLLTDTVMGAQSILFYCGVTLFVLLCVTSALSFVNTKSTKFTYLFNFIKSLHSLTTTIIATAVAFKVLIFIHFTEFYNAFTIKYVVLTLTYRWLPIEITANMSIFSDVTFLLAFISGKVCLYLLGSKNFVKLISNVSLFSLFLIATLFMVYTTNLLVMFISFEFLFLPTLYFAYSQGYVKRLDRSLWYLLQWTLTGSFLTLVTLAYVYYKYKTLNMFYLMPAPITSFEHMIIYFAIFLGFGIKIPMFPFHFWLTKIHVEAPAGFSIFLSGFLVKAALYCFYMFNVAFMSKFQATLMIMIAALGVIESSFKMWGQTDFKKLIALATIQEMNLLIIMLILSPNLLSYGLVMFMLLHGLLTALLFHSVDVVQRKFGTRNITQLSGVGSTSRQLTLLLWYLLIVFSGFPLTVKFAVEWHVLGVLLCTAPAIAVVALFLIAVIGLGGFTKQILIVLYGNPREHVSVNGSISKTDKFLLYISTFMLTLLHLLHFFL